MKKNIEKYNNEKNLLVISLYPKKGELYSAGTSGVASYTKNVISNMERDAIVLADYDKKESTYEEDNTLVMRCFKTNSPLMWVTILRTLRDFRRVKKVLIQFDFAVYGRTLTSCLIIPFVLLLAVLGYEVSIVLHHVVTDVRKLKGHVGLTNSFMDRLKARVYNVVFHVFYTLLCLFTKQIIVLEKRLEEKLQRMVPFSRNITTIPHGVDTSLVPMNKEKARNRLNIGKKDYVVLFFGFINWFKGADFFAKSFEDKDKALGKTLRAIMAGGKSPTLKDKGYYKKYYSAVEQTVLYSKSTKITGYVAQEDIRTYFSAADIVVFPYRHFMTASGVLSLVFSYKKPFIISESLSKMFSAPDFSKALKETGLQKSDIVFSLNKNSFLQTTETVLKNGLKQKLVKLTEIMRENRSYKNTAALFDKAIFYQPATDLKKAIILDYTS